MTTHCITLTACVGNGGPAASLPEDLWTYIFEAICFIHMKFMIKQGLSHELAFDEKAFKTFDKFRTC